MTKVSQDVKPVEKCLTTYKRKQTLNQIFQKQHLKSFHKIGILLIHLITAASNSNDCEELAGLQGIAEVCKVYQFAELMML